MKIVAYSLVPPTPVPYLHLGYISAFESNHANQITSAIPGLQAILSACFALSVLGVLLFRYAGQRVPCFRPAFLGMAMLAFLAMVAGIVCNSMNYPPRFAHPVATTRYHLQMLQSNLAYRLEIGEPAPSSIQGLNADSEMLRAYYERRRLAGDLQDEDQDQPKWFNDSRDPDMLYKDGWLHPLKLECRRQDGLREYLLISAGPDGIFANRDDIRMSVTDRVITETRMRYLITLVNQLACRTATPAPTDMAVIARSEKIVPPPMKAIIRKTQKPLPADTRDAWGQAFRIIRSPKALFAESLVSAGPDRRWRTADDITVKRRPDKVHNDVAYSETMENGRDLCKQISKQVNGQNDLNPALVQRACRDYDIDAKYLLDGWGRPYRLSLDRDNAEALLHSSGPDRKFGTEDDIKETLHL